jgi:hypothetical protein
MRPRPALTACGSAPGIVEEWKKSATVAQPCCRSKKAGIERLVSAVKILKGS